jgi:hypothetical protein
VLVEIASKKGQDHLLAISGRPNCPRRDRRHRRSRRRQGDPKTRQQRRRQVFRAGFSTIVARAGADDELVEIPRPSRRFPAKFMRDLLRRAKEAVRARPFGDRAARVQEEIKRVLNEIAREAPPRGRSFGVAEEYVKLMKGLNELGRCGRL